MQLCTKKLMTHDSCPVHCLIAWKSSQEVQQESPDQQNIRWVRDPKKQLRRSVCCMEHQAKAVSRGCKGCSPHSLVRSPVPGLGVAELCRHGLFNGVEVLQQDLHRRHSGGKNPDRQSLQNLTNKAKRQFHVTICMIGMTA